MALIDFLRMHWPVLLVPLLGLLAVYALLPRPRRFPVVAGALCGLAALVLGGLFLVRVVGLTTESFLFYLFAGVAVLAGVLLITQTNPARAALSFAVVVLASSGLYLLQAAPFLMAASVIVYAGAIIVTFLFVIMLSQQEGPSDADARSREPFLAALTGFLLLAALLYVLRVTYKPDLARWVEKSERMLARLEEAPAQGSDFDALTTELEDFRVAYDHWWKNQWRKDAEGAEGSKPSREWYPPPGGKPLADALGNATLAEVKGLARGKLKDDLVTSYRKVVEAGQAAQRDPLLGSLLPATSKLSELSGPRPSRPLGDLRRDEEGRPMLPAENTRYLGRSLFTDYLLAVELAGMLLLVATIGAIAVASRRGPSASALNPQTNGPAPRRSA
jgi:NADH:ubiquinone oxidoreductase subunit 6 (subunit J)